MRSLNIFLCITLFSIVTFAKPIRVLMIDAGRPVKYNKVAGKHLSTATHTHIHSTAMFKFITEGEKLMQPIKCKELIVDTCDFLDATGVFDAHRYHFCLNEAIKNKYDIVNMSLSGGQYDVTEHLSLNAIKRHSIVVISAGNEGHDYRDYPSLYATGKDGPIYAISAVDSDGKRMKFSNKDKNTVDFLGEAWYNMGFMQGTSVAAALFTHSLIERMCK